MMMLEELPSVQKSQEIAAAYRLLANEVHRFSEGVLVHMRGLHKQFPSEEVAQGIQSLERLLSEIEIENTDAAERGAAETGAETAAASFYAAWGGGEG
jgi:hypothetical protein